MRKLFELIKCDCGVFIREPMGRAFIILFPILILIANYLFDASTTYLTAVFSGTIGLTIMSASIMGGAITICINRETNVLKRYKISNIKSYMVFASIFVVQMLLTSLSVILQFIVAIFLFCLEFSNMRFSAFILDYIISSVLLLSLGLFISSCIRNTKNLHGAASLVFSVMMLLGGSAFPIERMPAIMQKIVLILPITHVNLSLHSDLAAISNGHIVFYIYSCIAILVCLSLGINNFKWEVEPC